MGALKVLLWTACAVALGVWLGTGKVDGRTPLDHAERSWKQHVPAGRVDALTAPVQDALDDVKDAVSRDPAKPRERHSETDRQALDSLISRRAGSTSSHP